MSISIRSHTSVGAPGGSVSSLQATITGVQSGDTLVCLIAAQGTIQSVTDNNGNTWTEVANAKIASQCDIYMVQSANAGSTTVTVTLTGSTFNIGFAIYDLNNKALVATGAVAQSSSTSTSFNGPSLTINNPGVYLALLLPPIVTGENSVTVGTPWAIDETISTQSGFANRLAVSVQGASLTQQPIFSNLTANSGAIYSTGIALSDVAFTSVGGTPPDVFDPKHVTSRPFYQPRRAKQQPSPLKPWYAGRVR